MSMRRKEKKTAQNLPNESKRKNLLNRQYEMCAAHCVPSVSQALRWKIEGGLTIFFRSLECVFGFLLMNLK